MLKPKRKITKKEIRRDPLLETIHRGEQFYTANRKVITYAGGGLAAMVVIGLLILSSGRSSRTAADAVMSRALVSYRGEDFSAAVADFDILINEYPRTPAGNEAQYYLGQTLLHQGSEEEAKTRLEGYVASVGNTFLAVGALQTLAELAFKDGEYSEAASYFEKAAHVSDVPTVSNQNFINAALAAVKADNYEEAKRLLDVIPQDEARFSFQTRIDEVIAMVNILSSHSNN